MSESQNWNLSVEGSPPFLRIGVAGEFGMEDWAPVLAAVPATEGFRPGMSSLVDARNATFDISAADVRRLAKDMGPHLEHRGGGGFRSAIVVEKDVAYGLSRMLQTWAERADVDIAVFRSVEEAEAWLRGDGLGGRSLASNGSSPEQPTCPVRVAKRTGAAGRLRARIRWMKAIFPA